MRSLILNFKFIMQNFVFNLDSSQLPKSYKHKIESQTETEYIIRADLKEAEISPWSSEFENSTNTQWNLRWSTFGPRKIR